MPFSEEIKKEVRRKAAYVCCSCQKNAISMEVHHIIPQEKKGPDTIDNAAPLCPSCHADFGGNPEKRSRIKEMRNWWYEIVDRKYNSKDAGLIASVVEQLTDMKSKLSKVSEGFKFKNGAYWIDGDSEPFCSRCWEADKAMIHLHPCGNPAHYKCPNCKGDSVVAKPELDPPRAKENDFYFNEAI